MFTLLTKQRTAPRTRMRSRFTQGLIAACSFLLFAEGSIAAGLMTPNTGNLPALDIRQHHVNVVIEDGYAITRVDQEFYNPNAIELEATYSFPVPEKASVGEFTYWIDGKPVTGEVLEKDKARTLYEQEKAQGRETALTEQDGFHSFDSHVYPVLPQQNVKIRLVYIQPVHIDSSIGRYIYPLEEGGTDEEKLAFFTYNNAVTEAFSFNLEMRSSYPIDSFRLPQHSQAAITQTSAQEWSVSMANAQGNANNLASNLEIENESVDGITDKAELENEGATAAASNSPHIVQRLDKDIVVYWRHQQGLPGSIDMITHKPAGSRRGTFMMTMTPGDDLSTIQQGRDWVFVLDTSGSMKGKYHSLVEGVNKGLKKLDPQDRFRIVLFSNATSDLTNGYVPVTAENITHYSTKLEATVTQGGTNLYAGLEQGIKGLDSDRPSAILLVTDGVANIGVTEKKQFLTLLERYDVRLFSFVMGNSANRPLLEGMTKVSNGFAMNISNSDDIVGQLVLAADKLNHEAYRDIKIDIDGVKVTDMTPARIGSLYRGQQLIVFGHYWGGSDDEGVESNTAKVRISGKVSGEEKVYSTRFTFPKQSEMNPEIERLWAYASIEDLQNRIDYLGEDHDSKEAIIDLAIEYGLVTNHTSMVVVREEVFEEQGIERKNAARVATEEAAREQRKQSAVRDNRVDTQEPAFSQPRAYPKSGGSGSSGGSGGGAFGPWVALLLLPLLTAKKKPNTNA